MTMYENAERINKEIKEFFNSPLQQFNDEQKEWILNLVISVGQVAKFRCRSNVAFDNFIGSCFKEVAECKRVGKDEDSEWLSLRAFIESNNKNLEKAND